MALSANSLKDKLRGKDRAILNDNLGEDFHAFLLSALTPMLNHCTGGAYIAMSSSELDTLQSAFRAAGGYWSTFIIGPSIPSRWAGRITITSASTNRSCTAGPKASNGTGAVTTTKGDVWQIKKPIRNDLHPTMKPVELVERAIRNSNRPGDLVLDRFAGSGTTLIAAEKSGRTARLIELDPRYVDVIVRRWELFTGRHAVREASGEPFPETQAARG